MVGETRILLAEDKPILRMLMAEALQDAGYTVQLAADGAQALRLLETEGFALVLTDINMPEADGIEVARSAREHNALLPVIFMSGRPNYPKLKNTAQPWFYLGKPFDISHLVAIVSGFLRSPPCMTSGGSGTGPLH